jgi:hypothetical protein
VYGGRGSARPTTQAFRTIEETSTSLRRLRSDVLLFAATAVLAALPTVAFLVQQHGDVSALLRIGTKAAARSFVERDFAHPVLTPGYGHDGQQFYVIARTFPDLQRADGHVDRLAYRARRIVFPLLVAPLPAGPPTAWAMLAVNLAAIGFAGVGIGRLAARAGLSPLVGLAAGVTPALFMSARASLGDALAFSLAIWGVALWRTHVGWAALLFTLAALTREHTLVVPAACAVVGLWERRRGTNVRLSLLAAPFAVYAVWVVALGLSLHPARAVSNNGPVADALRAFEPPFRAWFEIGFRDRAVLLGIVMAFGSLVAAYVLRATFPELSVWLLADTVLVVIAAPVVAGDLLNYARVAPLAVPALALAVAVQRTRTARDGRGPVPTARSRRNAVRTAR